MSGTPANTDDPTADDFVYDEFAWFHENAAEHDLAYDGPPVVQRVAVPLDDGRSVSALLWGDHPELVFIHGTAQNAHTWDTVVMALGRDALAVDLPGHGHSDWRDDRAYDPHNLADDVAVAIAAFAPRAQAVVGMSLGGMVTNALAARHPQLVSKVVVVDVTPGVTREKAKHIHEFVSGPPGFPSFAEIFERTVQFNPTRSESSLRRGIVHNAERRPDGSWQWRSDRRGRAETAPEGGLPEVDRSALWADIDAIDPATPYFLARGGAEGSVVDDADVAALLEHRPDAEVVVVDDAGHSIQGDQPLVLAALINTWVF